MSEAMPKRQRVMLDELGKLLKSHGFPGGFVIFFAEDDNGKTAMGGTLNADDTLTLMEDGARELRENFGASRTKQ